MAYRELVAMLEQYASNHERKSVIIDELNQDSTNREIAKKLDVTESAVSHQVRKIRSDLKGQFNR